MPPIPAAHLLRLLNAVLALVMLGVTVKYGVSVFTSPSDFIYGVMETPFPSLEQTRALLSSQGSETEACPTCLHIHTDDMDMEKLWDDTPTPTLKISYATPFILRSIPTPTPPPRLTNTTPAPSRFFELQTFLRYIAGFTHTQISGTLHPKERQALVVVFITIIGSFLPISLAYGLASCQRPLDSMRRPPISEAHDIGERLIGEGRFDRKTYRRIKRLLAKDKARINHIANLRLKSLRIFHGQELKVADEEKMKLTDEQELTKADEQELTKVDEQELTETDEQELTKADEQELTKADEQDLTKADKQELTETNEQDFIKTNEQDFTETDEQGFTETDEQELTTVDERPASTTANIVPSFGASLLMAELYLRNRLATIEMTEGSREDIVALLSNVLHSYSNALAVDYSRVEVIKRNSLRSDDDLISDEEGLEDESGTEDTGAEIQHNDPALREPSRFVDQAPPNLPEEIRDSELENEAPKDAEDKGLEDYHMWLKWKLACIKGGDRTPESPEPSTEVDADAVMLWHCQGEEWAALPSHDAIQDCERNIVHVELEIAHKRGDSAILQPPADPTPKLKYKRLARDV